MRKIIILCAAIGLSGCSTFQSLTGNPAIDLPAVGNALSSADSTAQQSVAAIAKFTVADLQAADMDAVANMDQAAHQCYQALIPVAQAQQNPGAAVVGAVSTFQRTRDMVKLVKGQGAIAQACAALKQDVTGDVLGIGTLFGIP